MKEKLIQLFHDRFGVVPQIVAQAPGRLEILGNHTDYNGGTTLSVAVDRYIWIALSPAAGRKCTLWDEDLQEERVFSLDELDSKTDGDWSNYVKGVVFAMMKAGYQVPGFQAVIQGNVPMSAGMSSSAAFEMSVVTALERLCNLNLGWLTLARLGQSCENEYIGAHTGLLDQFSSLRGKKDSLVYSDFRTLETSVVPMPQGASFVVVNSMVKHVLTGEYNERRTCCEDAVKYLQGRYDNVRALRDVTPEQLQACRNLLPPRVYQCASHVVGEISRVDQGIRCLQRGDLSGFGQLLWQSHESSRLMFRNSCAELDLLVDLAREMPECLGARLSGGGFGGISIHLLREADASEYAERIAAEYEKKTGIRPQTFLCRAADGAVLL